MSKIILSSHHRDRIQRVLASFTSPFVSGPSSMGVAMTPDERNLTYETLMIVDCIAKNAVRELTHIIASYGNPTDYYAHKRVKKLTEIRGWLEAIPRRKEGLYKVLDQQRFANSEQSRGER